MCKFLIGGGGQISHRGGGGGMTICTKCLLNFVKYTFLKLKLLQIQNFRIYISEDKCSASYFAANEYALNN